MFFGPLKLSKHLNMRKGLEKWSVHRSEKERWEYWEGESNQNALYKYT